MVDLGGRVSPGWNSVASAFEANFESRNEGGAALCVYVDGEPVVDIWAGVADEVSGSPWTEDTVALSFSCAKGLTAISVHMLVEQGLLDLDTPVARYWPEFAQAGKAEVPVRWLLSHQVGLPYVDNDLSLADLLAHRPVIEALEQQAPHWTPGESFAYHAITFGHLVGELVHRVSGMSLSEFVYKNINGPLGANSWIGLPEDFAGSVARMVPPAMDISMFLPADSPPVRAISLSGALPLQLVTGEPGDLNDRRVLALGLGGSHLVTDARSLAKIYAATIGEVDGVRLLETETVSSAVEIQTANLQYFGVPSAPGAPRPVDFSQGFMVLTDPLGPASFGHSGASGALGFADPEYRVGFGYVTSRMGAVSPDNRAATLVDAVRACLQ